MTKRLVWLILLISFLGITVSTSAQRRGGGGTVHVRGYTRSNGTYVPPHYRSAPDGDFYNNWSTKGNVNPYTGKEGTRVTPPARSTWPYSSYSPSTPIPFLPLSGERRDNSYSPSTRSTISPDASRTYTPSLPPLPPRPLTFEEHYDQAMKYYRGALYAPAVDSFRKALLLRSDDAKAHYFLGVNLMILGRDSEALRSFERASELNPTSPGPHFFSGWEYGLLGDESNSVAQFKQAIRLAPDYAPGHFELGVTYHSFGHYGRAVRPLKEAIRLDPQDADARYELGVVYVTLGRKSLAMEQYKALTELDSGKAAKLYARASR